MIYAGITYIQQKFDLLGALFVVVVLLAVAGQLLYRVSQRMVRLRPANDELSRTSVYRPD